MGKKKQEAAWRCPPLPRTLPIPSSPWERVLQSSVIIQAAGLRRTYPRGSCSCDRHRSWGFNSYSSRHPRMKEAGRNTHKGEEVMNKACCSQDSSHTLA